MNALDYDPAVIYTPDFFDMHREWEGDYQLLAMWIHAHWAPDSVADFGCGNAFLLKHLARLDAARRLCGIDGSRHALAAADPEIRPVLQHRDLRQAFWLGLPFDLVVCLEVAEHLESWHADRLVATLTEHAARRILFSAATPGQVGLYHINCQPHEYWLQKFAARGWRPIADAFPLHLALLDLQYIRWLINNVFVLEPIQ